MRVGLILGDQEDHDGCLKFSGSLSNILGLPKRKKKSLILMSTTWGSWWAKQCNCNSFFFFFFFQSVGHQQIHLLRQPKWSWHGVLMWREGWRVKIRVAFNDYCIFLCYFTGTLSWELCPTQGRQPKALGHTTAVVGDTLYIFGGIYHGNATNTLYMLNTGVLTNKEM